VQQQDGHVEHLM